MLSQPPCGLLIKQIHDAIERRANNELRSMDLTSTQFTLLMTLSGFSDKSASLKELERALCIAQSTAAGIVVRLEQKKFVASYNDPSDKRIKIVRITEEGVSCCSKAKKSIELEEQRILSGLHPDEQAIFRKLLQRVSNNAK